MDYINFASKISFFEFTQNEFKEQSFNCDEYEQEINLLKKQQINIENLSELLRTNPKIIDIFEELFQLNRFTNAQLIHFCFDVGLLNNSDEKTIISHFEKSILNFENGTENPFFKQYFKNITEKDRNKLVYLLKKAIVDYVDKIIKDKALLHNHIKNSIATRIRISRYLIENLKADEFIARLDIRSVLNLKRNPVDTKSIHGKFGTYKIEHILKELGFANISIFIKEKSITPDFFSHKSFASGYCYITEKQILGINKKRDNKPKKFDFILIFNNKIEFLVETNFYSTSGTKIGINQNEYVDLKQTIDNFNAANNTNFKFMWITDGNYWLSKDGEKRYRNLKDNYFCKNYELLNYNLLKEYLKSIIQ